MSVVCATGGGQLKNFGIPASTFAAILSQFYIAYEFGTA